MLLESSCFVFCLFVGNGEAGTHISVGKEPGSGPMGRGRAAVSQAARLRPWDSRSRPGTCPQVTVARPPPPTSKSDASPAAWLRDGPTSPLAGSGPLGL